MYTVTLGNSVNNETHGILIHTYTAKDDISIQDGKQHFQSMWFPVKS